MKKQANCLRCLKYQEIGAKRHSQITGSLPIDTLYSAAYLAKDDSALLRRIVEESPALCAVNTVFEDTLIAEHYWVKEVQDIITWELQKQSYPDEEGRFFWKAPGLFLRKNQTARLYNDMSTYLIDSIGVPQHDWDFAVWNEIWNVTDQGLLRDIHPNAIGYMTAEKSLDTFELILSRFNRTQFYLYCVGAASAARVYQLEHGELPDSLEDLVPGYLGSIPIDPINGLPVRYRDGLLYGLGEDWEEGGDYWGGPFEDAEDPSLLVPGTTWKP
jgi:hypothetical protein